MTLQERNILPGPLKRRGQNFLVDNDIARRVVETGEIGTEDIVLEPGAGYGTLTQLIALEARKVLAVEKDHRLAANLRKLFREQDRVSVLEGDVLKLDLPHFDRIIGTPPYYISSKLVLFMLKKSFRLASLVFQAEFGARLVARPGTTDYGRLSAMVQNGLSVELVSQVSRTAFQPKPRVDSVLLRIQKREAGRQGSDFYEWVVRESFTQRRRLVKGALKHALEENLGKTMAGRLIDRLQIPAVRVYQMSPEDFEGLTRQLEEAFRMEALKLPINPRTERDRDD